MPGMPIEKVPQPDRCHLWSARVVKNPPLVESSEGIGRGWYVRIMGLLNDVTCGLLIWLYNYIRWMLTISNYLGFILSNIWILGGSFIMLDGWLVAPRSWMSFPVFGGMMVWDGQLKKMPMPATWVINHVPIFHITQPLGIWSTRWLL